MTPAQYIEIRNAADKPVAFLSPQADGLKADTAFIDNELNGNCSLTFELPLISDKWAYITDAYEFVVGGKRFILLKPDTEEIVRDGQKVWGKVTAQEKWVELDKEYVTVSNDPQYPGPTWSVVRIVSGGTPAGGYSAGSAGSALTYLLAGSGWTVGTVDVTGTFDLETEKISTLANIKKVQELWGGYLIWDSENKTVSLRDEATWQNYTGFQVRYAKNLKGITRTVNRDLVTRLYPFGKEDLNIGSVNGGVIYLENKTYTNKIYEGQWVNQDIANSAELKAKAIAELAKLCKPRYSYKITMLDLSVKPQWAHETFAVGDMADVIDDTVGANDRLRITRHKYNVFQPWKCEIDVGEPLERLASRIATVSNVTEKVLTNTGTANILRGIINTKATEINGASGDYSLVDGVSTWFGSAGGVRNGKVTRITPNGLVISVDGAQTWRTAIDGSGIYADKLIVSDAYALGSGDGYTKMGSSGISVMDSSNVVKAFLGQYASGKFGLKLYDGDIEITSGNSKTILNPTDGFKMQKLTLGEWVNQFYVDSNGNVKFAGTLESATGTISAVTIKAGVIKDSNDNVLIDATNKTLNFDNFTTKVGKLTATNIDGTNLSVASATVAGSASVAGTLSVGASLSSPVITGGSLEIGNDTVKTYINTSDIFKIKKGVTDIFKVDASGNLAITGSYAGGMPAATITNVYVTNGQVSGGSIVGSSININDKFTVDSSGNFVSSEADIKGKFEVYDGTTLLGRLHKNAVGGLLHLYNTGGTVDARIGTYSGLSPTIYNRGGSMSLFDNMPSAILDESTTTNLLKYQRVVASCVTDANNGSGYSHGVFQLKQGYHDIGIAGEPRDTTDSRITVHIGGGEGSTGYGYALFRDNSQVNKVKLSALANDPNYIMNTLGIGTSTPNTSYKLDVNGTINSTGLKISGSDVPTTSAVSGMISSALSSYSTTSQMNTAISNALSSYSTTSQVENMIDNAIADHERKYHS